METERICPNCRKPLPPDVPLGLCPECLIKSGFPTGTEPSAGSVGRFVPPPVEEIAKLFPQFEILNFIGKGGMGAVYKARQPGLDRFVALKVLPPAVANDPGFAERFNREARALARLSHPNIVVVYDFGKAGELHYLVMEFVDGANLREVERAGRLSPEQALAIVPQICEALQFAHNEGIVHRDIKPENLLLDKKGRVKITDFGIAKIMGVTESKVSLTGAKDVMGTPHYMAPEQIEKPQTVDHRADIYSLGVVFYEMLTGELPLGKFAPPSKKAPMDARLDEVVMHTLEKEPERRYQQASQVKTDVETIATGAPPPISGAAKAASAPPSTPPTPLQPVVSDRLILPAFLLAFFFGVFGAHCFYVGKIRTGLLKLAGLGGCVVMAMVCGSSWGDNLEPAPGILFATLIFGCGAWAVIDWILILCKVFTDGNGRRLVNWWHPNPNTPQPSAPPNPPKGPIPPKMGGASSGGRSKAMIIAPAIALIIAGCLKLFGAVIGLIFLLSFGAKHDHPLFFIPGLTHFLPAPIGAIALLFSVIPVAVMIYGGVEMLRLRSYAWAVTASVVAIIFCSLVGTPVGIWALIVLLMAGVRETFANRSAPPASVKGFWILGAVAVACLFLFLTISFFILLVHAHHGTSASSSFARMTTRVMQVPAVPETLLTALPADDQVSEAELELALQQIAKYPDMASIQNQNVTLSEQITEADAELARAKQQYARGLAKAMEVQLAEDKDKLLNAQRLLLLQTPGYERKHVTSAAYEQDLSDVINDQAKVAADEAALPASAQMTTNGTAPLNSQWKFEPTNGAQNLSFGPVRERTLRVDGNESDFLVFRSGEVLRHAYVDGDANNSIPPTAFMKWVRENGVDAGFYADINGFPFDLLVLDMGLFEFNSDTVPASMIPRFRSVAEWQAYNTAHPDSPAKNPHIVGPLVGVTNVWNDLTANQLHGQLHGPTNDVPARFLREKLAALWLAPATLHGPIVFSTRDGLEGIMQITGFTDNPRGVKIRYKLVQSGTPESSLATPPPAAGEDTAVSSAKAWLLVVDNGNYDESWKESAPAFQNAVSETKWEDSMNTFRKPLGNLLARELISAQPATQLPGAPEGEYVVMQFKTSFENNKSAVETVTVGPKAGDQWKVSGYYIK